MSKAQIKKAVALGEQVHTKFMAHATRLGNTEAVNRILDNETNRAWAFVDAFGEVDIIVDGGKPQVSAFLNYLQKFNIPIIGIAKGNETLIIPRKLSGSNLEYVTHKIPPGSALN